VLLFSFVCSTNEAFHTLLEILSSVSSSSQKKMYIKNIVYKRKQLLVCLCCVRLRWHITYLCFFTSNSIKYCLFAERLVAERYHCWSSHPGVWRRRYHASFTLRCLSPIVQFSLFVMNYSTVQPVLHFCILSLMWRPIQSEMLLFPFSCIIILITY
jgi:hypothetical protein